MSDDELSLESKLLGDIDVIHNKARGARTDIRNGDYESATERIDRIVEITSSWQ